MIVIDPKYRKTIDIDGEKWTIRPLTWADKLNVSAIDGVDKWKEILKLAVTGHPKLVDIDGNEVAFDIDALPIHVVTRLMMESDAISNVSESTAKNSSSQGPCSLGSGKATNLDASKESGLPTMVSDGISRTSLTTLFAESQVS